MSFTLANLTYRVARELGIVSEGTATGGSTTTIEDTNLRTEADDYWNSGSIWILRDSSGAIVAPLGEYERVTDFANSGGVITFAALTVTVASGDKYAVAKKTYPLETLIRNVNEAVQDLGIIPQTDITTIDTETNKTEYSLPVAANLDLRRVWQQGNLDDANDNRWTLLYNWELQRTATGSKDLLVFPYQLPSGYDIKLEYGAPHPELHVYSDNLNEGVPITMVVYSAVARCLNWFRQKHNTNSRRLLDDIERYEERAEMQRQKWTRRLPPRTGKIMLVPKTTQVDTSDVPLTVSLTDDYVEWG